MKGDKKVLAENRMGNAKREEVFNGDTIAYAIYPDKTKHPDTRVHASGRIALYKGQSIPRHTHNDDSEEYTVIVGRVEVNGREYGPGENVRCEKGDSHYCKNLHSELSIIRFVKRR